METFVMRTWLLTGATMVLATAAALAMVSSPPKPLGEWKIAERTCIVVVQVMQEDEAAMIGLIVDGVSEVLTLSDGDIEDAPDFGEGVDTPFVLGIAKVKGAVKILLKIEDVLTLKELRGIEGFVQ